VDLANWRAILAPPGITDEEFAELRALVEESIATFTVFTPLECHRSSRIL
jgi:tripartite-type tricarboxylate transporter receptor subunit TctC